MGTSRNISSVLVTGADGFIGSHLVEELVMCGYKVTAFVQYNSFNSWGWLEHCKPELKGQFKVVAGDIKDFHTVKKSMEGCDAVAHLAALIAIPYSYSSPISYVDTNVKGTLNILQAAKDLSIKRIIHTSTSEVYGSAKFVPITEEHPIQGQSPYAASKIAADQLAYSFFKSFNLPVVILRPFNTYGPRQSARAIIPTVISQVASGVKEIQLGALNPLRDFTYVLDTVKGFIFAIESAQGIGEVVNLGSGFEISVQHTVDLIAELMNQEVKIVLDPARVRPENSEVNRLLASNTKAKYLFGWEPDKPGLEGFKSGLEKTISWFTNFENLKNYKSFIYNI